MVQGAHSPHVLSTGKLLLTGYGGTGTDFAAVRYDANGAHDLTYGGGDGISQFGIRAAPGQAQGTFAAGLVFEVVAPAT